MIEAVSPLSRERISTLYPGIRPLAYRILQDALKVTRRGMNVTEALRSMEQQEAIYSQGRTRQADGSWKITDSGKIVTNARPGLSFHCYGLAFDCAFAGADPYLASLSSQERQELWIQYGNVVKAYGMKWGGDFRLANGANDKPHAELSYGLSIAECLELNDRGGIQAIWAQIDKILGVPEGQDWGTIV